MFPEEHQIVLVVVRSVDVPRAFAWQIRRFGQIVPLAQSVETFAEAGEAGRAGEAALRAFRAEAASSAG